MTRVYAFRNTFTVLTQGNAVCNTNVNTGSEVTPLLIPPRMSPPRGPSLALPEAWVSLHIYSGMIRSRGVATNFRLGGQIPTGGTDSGESKLPTPKFNFCSDFSHFILKTLENLKFLTNMHAICLKNRDFCGDITPEFRTGGDTSPASQPVATPMIRSIHQSWTGHGLSP